MTVANSLPQKYTLKVTNTQLVIPNGIYPFETHILENDKTTRSLVTLLVLIYLCLFTSGLIFLWFSLLYRSNVDTFSPYGRLKKSILKCLGERHCIHLFSWKPRGNSGDTYAFRFTTSVNLTEKEMSHWSPREDILGI